MKFREVILKSGAKIILGKDAKSNEELVNKFKGKENIIFHTSKPGSPFGVIEKEDPTAEEIHAGAIVVARYSQDWRDNKKDVKIDVFRGKSVYKLKDMPTGTFGITHKLTIIVKKQKILNIL